MTAAACGCATHPVAETRPMQTCVKGAVPAGVSSEAFSLALKQAQQFANETYGADCHVCAEVIDSADTYRLHITSPIDTLINTSAGLDLRKADGRVIKRSVWHSCHARLVRKAD
ncbi:hypothetical protein [Roseateles paludis]|jgi:hypothetical protein|uniref:Lipoprotein n=1 Tax=Roseateles paludis TaxID=3145238 RepID=A0ABV0G3H5_9BURK